MRVGVRACKEYTEHIVGGEPVTNAASLEIVESDGGFTLLYLDAFGRSMTDTWHVSLNEALAQAKAAFELDGPWRD